MTSMEWRAYFEQNRRDRVPVVWDADAPVSADVKQVLGASLGRFQLGETSDGVHLRAAAESVGDRNFGAAVEYFIAEKAEHARLLGRVLRILDAPVLPGHWTDWCCRRCRRVLGFYSEWAVLLCAEVVMLKYYGAIRRGVRQPAIEAVCDQILHDEKFHVRFHCESLHGQLAEQRLVRALFCYALTAVFTAASFAVAWFERRALSAMGCSTVEFLAGVWRNFRAARDGIYFGRPFALDATDQTEVLKEIRVWKILRP